MDWSGSRYDAGWIYRRVSWDTWEEVGEYGHFDGASVDFSLFDSLKVSGSAQYTGDPVDERDMIKLYYTFRDSAGEEALIPVATLLPEADSPEFKALAAGGSVRSGALKTYSTLKVLSDMKCCRPYVVPAGTDAVAAAVGIVEGAGLMTNRPSFSHALSVDRVFEPTDSMLTVVNALADAAGCGSVRPDEHGTVIISKYVEPTDRPVKWTFRDDADSTLGFGIVEDSDWRDIPNVLTLSHSDGGATVYATARNTDPRHRSSLPSRGWRDKSEFESVEELAGETPEEMEANLAALAESKLKSKSAEITKVNITTMFVPIAVDDSVRVEYGGKSWSGTVTSMSVSCVPSGEMSVEIRCFLQRDLQVEVETEVVWETNPS